jgi:hypothetical protein
MPGIGDAPTTRGGSPLRKLLPLVLISVLLAAGFPLSAVPTARAAPDDLGRWAAVAEGEWHASVRYEAFDEWDRDDEYTMTRETGHVREQQTYEWQLQTDRDGSGGFYSDLLFGHEGHFSATYERTEQRTTPSGTSTTTETGTLEGQDQRDWRGVAPVQIRVFVDEGRYQIQFAAVEVPTTRSDGRPSERQIWPFILGSERFPLPAKGTTITGSFSDEYNDGLYSSVPPPGTSTVTWTLTPV